MVLDFAPSFTLLKLNFIRKTRGKKSSVPELSLKTRPLQPNPEIFSLLSWHTQASTFAGREDELAALHAWAEDEMPISMRFVVGPGGVGKTRLAAQFGQALRKKDWAAGFVDLRHSGSYRLGKAGTLLIVDYPEQQFDKVDELFQDLASLEAGPGRLRILFLTRSPFDTWRDRTRDQGVLDLIDGQPIEPGVLENVDAQTIVNSVQATACDLEMCADLEPPRPFRANEVEHWMNQRPEHKLPLFLVAAGIYSALHPKADALSFTGPELVLALVDREWSRLRLASKAMGLGNEDALPRLLAMATVAGGMAWGDVKKEWPKLYPLLGAPENWDGKKELRQTGWLHGDIIPALTPDIVGAVFTAKVFEECAEDAPELIWLATKPNPEQAVANIGRITYDGCCVLNLNYSLVVYLKKTVLENENRCQCLSFMIHRILPYNLSSLAVSIGIQLQNSFTKPEELGFFLLNHSTHLYNSGDQESALMASREATKIFDKITDNNSKESLHALAMSLNNYSDDIHAANNAEAALQAITNAVKIYRILSATNPDKFLPELSMSLNNLSLRLVDSGSSPGIQKAALEAIKEAIQIRRALVEIDPIYRHNLSTSLNNLSRLLGDSGNTQKALRINQEAVDISRSVASENPATFLHLLVMCLGQRGELFFNSGDFIAAANTFKEGAMLIERYAMMHPNTFLGALYSKLQADYERAQKLLASDPDD